MRNAIFVLAIFLIVSHASAEPSLAPDKPTDQPKDASVSVPGQEKPREELVAPLRANLNKIRHCYEKALQTNPSLSGKMVFTWTVQADGKVKDVKTADGTTLLVETMRDCITNELAAIVYDKPKDGKPITITYPFVFNPL